MLPMDECSFVAHALRDYLRPHVENSDLSYIDSPLMCGEPFTSILASLDVAIERAIAFPDVYINHVREIPGVTSRDREALADCFERLPDFEIAA